MRVLLDECVPADLAKVLPGHEVTTVPRMGLSSTKDGPLLRRAALEFDVFITVDRSLVHQQQMPDDLAVITLRVPNNRAPFVLPLAPAILSELETIKPGDSIELVSDSVR